MLGAEVEILPGLQIEPLLKLCSHHKGSDVLDLQVRLSWSCRKPCFLWQATHNALEAEHDFYCSTNHETPALFGEYAVNLAYHLEASVLFARSALDIGSRIFGWAFPDPFPRRDFNSFNKLVKTIVKTGTPYDLAKHFKNLRENQTSWFSIVSGTERGRSLRDQISHQTEFPIDYRELNLPSEKECPVVVFAKHEIPLEKFLLEFRTGVVGGFCRFEQQCVNHLKELSS